MLIRPNTCVLIIVMHEAMWFVDITSYVICCFFVWLHVVLVVVIDRMRMITWYMVCCAKCQFPPFLPFSSITMPPSWKMLTVSKTPENSTLRAYRLILPAYDTIRSHFLYYRTKFWKWQIKIDSLKSIYNTRYTLHDMHFLVNTIYYHLVNLIYYHLPNYPYYTNYYI